MYFRLLILTASKINKAHKSPHVCCIHFKALAERREIEKAKAIITVIIFYHYIKRCNIS